MHAIWRTSSHLRVFIPLRFEMYDTAFTDRTLEYGESAYAPFGNSGASGPVLGNGNLQMRLSASPNGLCECVATTVGHVDTLSFTEIRKAGSEAISSVKSVSLNLANATYRTVSGVSDADFVATLTCVRHSPSVSIQSVWTRDASTLEHVVSPPTGMKITRSDVVIRNVGGVVLPHLAIEGFIGSTRVAYCCIYAGNNVVIDGAREADPSSATVRSVVRTTAPDTTVSMMHSVLHGADVTSAHAFRACEVHFRTNASPAESISAVKKVHVARWDSLWKGTLAVEASPQATPDEAEALRKLNLHIQTSLYCVYSGLPDPAAVARSDEAQYQEGLPQQGYAITENLAIAPVAPWLKFMQRVRAPDERTPMYQVAGEVNDAWDGYRTTLDRTRLALHYPALRHHMHELTTRIENSLPSSVTGASITTGTVTTRTGELVSEDPYTTGVAKRAFLSGEQICNALRMPADQVWEELRSKLVVPRTSPFSTEISGVAPPASNRDGIVLLHPGALTVYANSTDLGQYVQLMDGNSSALLAAAQGPACPAAFAAIAALAADSPRITSVEDRSARIDFCATWLLQQCAESVDSLWGCAAHSSSQTASDILACILYGFSRVKVRGFVTRDGIHTVPASLLPGPSTAILPQRWSVIRRRMSRSINQQAEFLTQNARR